MDAMPRLDGKLENLKSNATTMINIGKESFKEAEKITLDTFEEITEKISSMAKKTQTFVRENPAISIAAVLIAGFVITKVVRDQRKQKQTHQRQANKVH